MKLRRTKEKHLFKFIWFLLWSLSFFLSFSSWGFLFFRSLQMGCLDWNKLLYWRNFCVFDRTKHFFLSWIYTIFNRKQKWTNSILNKLSQYEFAKYYSNILFFCLPYQLLTNKNNELFFSFSFYAVNQLSVTFEWTTRNSKKQWILSVATTYNLFSQL